MRCAALQHRRVPRDHIVNPVAPAATRGANREIFCAAWGFPVKRPHQVQVYQARNDIHLAVELVLGAAVRLCHPGILLYPAYAVLHCYPDAACLLVALLLPICQISGLLLLLSLSFSRSFVRHDYVCARKILLHSLIPKIHVCGKPLAFWIGLVVHFFSPPAKRNRIFPEQCYVMGLSNDGAADSQDDVVVCSGHWLC